MFCFSALLVYILYASCINRTVSLVFSFPYLSYMANLFYYSMYLVNQRFYAKEGFYYSIVQVIKVILNFDSDINHMYVFDSYMLILCKSIVSPSIHEDLHASSKLLEFQIRSIDQFHNNIVQKQYLILSNSIIVHN